MQSVTVFRPRYQAPARRTRTFDLKVALVDIANQKQELRRNPKCNGEQRDASLNAAQAILTEASRGMGTALGAARTREKMNEKDVRVFRDLKQKGTAAVGVLGATQLVEEIRRQATEEFLLHIKAATGTSGEFDMGTKATPFTSLFRVSMASLFQKMNSDRMAELGGDFLKFTITKYFKGLVDKLQRDTTLKVIRLIIDTIEHVGRLRTGNDEWSLLTHATNLWMPGPDEGWTFETVVLFLLHNVI
jgi:hypothetical protein